MGVEYDYMEGQVHPVVIYRALEATEGRPAIILGTSSAWPSGEVDGNAATLTASQMLSDDLNFSLGVAQILETEEWRYPGSISYQIKEGLSTTLMYDGDNLHPILTVDRSGASFQFILLGGEDPAIAVSLFQ